MTVAFFFFLFFCQQGNSVNDIKVPGLKSTGFTGTMAYKGTMDTVFQGTSPKESYLVLDVLDSSSR